MTVSALMTRTRDAVLPPFEEIVAEHGPVVMRVCRALLGPADAADAWSETFLSALEAYPKLRSESSIRAWLVTIAHRKAIDQRRGAARRPQPAGDLPYAEVGELLESSATAARRSAADGIANLRKHFSKGAKR